MQCLSDICQNLPFLSSLLCRQQVESKGIKILAGGLLQVFKGGQRKRRKQLGKVVITGFLPTSPIPISQRGGALGNS